MEQLLLVFIPIILVQLGLMIYALVDIIKNRQRYDNNTFVVWLLIILLVNIIGPIIYFVVGRKEQ